MRARIFLLLLFAGLIAVGPNPQALGTSPRALGAVPDVFASPIHAACYQVSQAECKIHVHPFTIQINPGSSLQAFRVMANGMPVYDFSTDVSNPPASSYTPSTVKLDFAARCSQVYTINLLARDSNDANFLNTGLAENVACPIGTFTVLLPLLENGG